MRIKNKEIRARQHRKEQKIKEAQRQLRAQYGDGKTATGEKTAVKKASPAKAAAKAAPKKTETAAKPAAKKTAAPKAKKEEPKAE